RQRSDLVRAARLLVERAARRPPRGEGRGGMAPTLRRALPAARLRGGRGPSLTASTGRHVMRTASGANRSGRVRCARLGEFRDRPSLQKPGERDPRAASACRTRRGAELEALLTVDTQGQAFEGNV